MNTVVKKVGTVEKLDAVVTAESSLDGLTVEISLQTSAGVHDWKAAGWVGTPTTTGTARTTSAVTLSTVGRYIICARVTATPETPVILCYYLHVIP